MEFDLEQREEEIELLKRKLRHEQDVVDWIIRDCKPYKSLQCYFGSHLDSISVRNNKAFGAALVTERAEVPKREDLPQYEEKDNEWFITLSFPHNDKIRLNTRLNLRYKDYNSNEQYIIINRIKNMLPEYSSKYEIHYEYTKSGELHAHLLVTSRDLPKNITIAIKRFYNIFHDSFCILKPVTDRDYLVNYLTDKQKKDYQTSGIKPYFYPQQ